MSWRPFAVRRNSTSETLSSNLAAGSYAASAAAGFKPETPATPNALIVLRKARRGKRDAMSLLELRQHRLGAAHFVFPRRFDVELLHHAVLDQHRVALRAHAHVARREVELEAERLGPLHAAVAEHADLAACLLVAAPRGHDESVVGRDAPDLVDFLR